MEDIELRLVFLLITDKTKILNRKVDESRSMGSSLQFVFLTRADLWTSIGIRPL